MHEIIAGKRPSLVFAGFVYLVFILVLLVTVNNLKSPAMKAEAYNDGVLHPLPRTGDQRLTSRALCTIYTLSSTAVMRITTLSHQWKLFCKSNTNSCSLFPVKCVAARGRINNQIFRVKGLIHLIVAKLNFFLVGGK